MFYWIFVFALAFAILRERNKIERLSARLDSLSERVSELHNELRATHSTAGGNPRAEERSVKSLPSTPDALPVLDSVFTEPSTKFPPRAFRLHRRPVSENRAHTEPRFWNGLDRTFIEHWTGILGSIAMVAGVGFLGISATLQMAPFSRVVMILAFSAALFSRSRSFDRGRIGLKSVIGSEVPEPRRFSSLASDPEAFRPSSGSAILGLASEHS